MSSKREALVARFTGGSLERIRRMKAALLGQEQGSVDHEALRQVMGELHTLKGESGMMGFAEVSRLAHVIEGCLVIADAEEARRAGVCAQVRQAFDVMVRLLNKELGDERAAAAAVDEAQAQLKKVAAGGSDHAEAVPSTEPEAPAPNAPASDAPAPNAKPLPASVAEKSRVPSAAKKSNTASPAVKPQAAATLTAASAAAKPLAAKPTAEQWAQVRVHHIDELCERIYEFSAHFSLLQSLFSQDRQRATKLETGEAQWQLWREEFERCRTQLDDVSSSAWGLRLVPVETSLNQLRDYLQDLAAGEGKQVRVVVQSGDALLERGVLDALWDPLVHLVRNAIAHGIEPPSERQGKPPLATITLSAETVQSNVVLTVADDGRGIDPARVRKAAVAQGLVAPEAADALTDADVYEFLFLHGFSTRAEVDEVSGRGVGLDVVRRKVEGLRGTVNVSSEIGRSTRFALSVPATISRERVIVVAVGSALYGLVSTAVTSVLGKNETAVLRVAGSQIVRYDGEALPLRSLAQVMEAEAKEEPTTLILSLAGKRWAFSVARVLGEYELLRRPVDPLLANMPLVDASALLADGRLVLFLHLPELLRRVENVRAQLPRAERHKQRVLVVDDSKIIRDLISDILVGAGLEVSTAQDAPTALKLFEDEPPDLILSDVEMPRMSGLELLQSVREKSHRVPFIMVTTRGSDEDRQRAAVLGANAYLVKSNFEGATLLETVRQFVDVHR